MAPGANIGDNFALFEPIHGSAPNRAGKHTANPISMILSAKMMLDWLGEKYNDKKCTNAGKAIENGVIQALRNGQTVPDCGGNTTTVGMAEAIAAAITVKTG
jgi:3-isopropylmalate dehydrogenase